MLTGFYASSGFMKLQRVLVSQKQIRKKKRKVANERRRLHGKKNKRARHIYSGRSQCRSDLQGERGGNQIAAQQHCGHREGFNDHLCHREGPEKGGTRNACLPKTKRIHRAYASESNTHIHTQKELCMPRGWALERGCVVIACTGVQRKMMKIKSKMREIKAESSTKRELGHLYRLCTFGQNKDMESKATREKRKSRNKTSATAILKGSRTRTWSEMGRLQL